MPTAGTSAHAFTLLHDSEQRAFRAQLDALGADTTLLVDTYDVARAVEIAVELAGKDLGAVRLDSGDLMESAHEVRAQLDGLGATRTRIIVTGDLDEFSIAALGAAPVDGYGVGTSLVTGSGAPTASLVFKLVARAESEDGPLRPVAKRSVGKPSRGGRKWGMRHLGDDGRAITEVVATSEPAPGPYDRDLMTPLVRGGEVVGREPVTEARARHERALAELPPQAFQLSRGEPAIPTDFR